MSKRYDAALGSELERDNALQLVKTLWWGALIVPLVLCFAMWGMRKLPAMGGQTGWGLLFLILALLWLVLLTPGVLILRSHCFRAAWQGQPVDPVSYVRGLITVWLVLEGVAFLSLASCAASGVLLPGVLPGALAILVLAITGPSGKALGLDD